MADPGCLDVTSRRSLAIGRYFVHNPWMRPATNFEGRPAPYIGDTLDRKMSMAYYMDGEAFLTIYLLLLLLPSSLRVGDRICHFEMEATKRV